MIDFQTAYDIALKYMPGYVICSTSELHDGFLFCFTTPEGDDLDIDPMLISKETGEIINYDYNERMEEIWGLSPLDLIKPQ